MALSPNGDVLIASEIKDFYFVHYLAVRGEDTALYKNGVLLYSYSYTRAFSNYCIME